MGVVFESGYSVTEGGYLLKEDTGTLLLEGGGGILIDSQPILTCARIAHKNNWLTGGTATASGTDADYFEDGPLNTLTYEAWKADALPASWEYTHSFGAAVDYFCIGAHTLGTTGAGYKVQYHDGSDWVDIIDLTYPTDDQPIFVLFSEKTASRWRLYIATANSIPRVGAVKVGVSMKMPRQMYGGHAPILFARQAVYNTSLSGSGNTLGRSLLRVSNATAYEWRHISADWVREYWLDFMKAAEAEDFFIAWRPATFTDVGFGRATTPPIPSNMGIRDLMSVTMQFEGVPYD